MRPHVELSFFLYLDSWRLCWTWLYRNFAHYIRNNSWRPYKYHNKQGYGSVSALEWPTEFGSALKSGDLGAQKMVTGRAVDAPIGGAEAQSLAVGIQNAGVGAQAFAALGLLWRGRGYGSALQRKVGSGYTLQWKGDPDPHKKMQIHHKTDTVVSTGSCMLPVYKLVFIIIWYKEYTRYRQRPIFRHPFFRKQCFCLKYSLVSPLKIFGAMSKFGIYVKMKSKLQF